MLTTNKNRQESDHLQNTFEKVYITMGKGAIKICEETCFSRLLCKPAALWHLHTSVKLLNVSKSFYLNGGWRYEKQLPLLCTRVVFLSNKKWRAV